MQVWTLVGMGGLNVSFTDTHPHAIIFSIFCHKAPHQNRNKPVLVVQTNRVDPQYNQGEEGTEHRHQINSRWVDNSAESHPPYLQKYSLLHCISAPLRNFELQLWSVYIHKQKLFKTALTQFATQFEWRHGYSVIVSSLFHQWGRSEFLISDI